MIMEKHQRELKIARHIYNLTQEYMRTTDISHHVVILNVDMQNKNNANIYYSLSGTPDIEAIERMHQELLRHIKPLRGYIAKNALLRYTPKLKFSFDPSYLWT